jgi:hypothetical protein
MYKAKRDNIALLMNVAVLSTACFGCINLDSIGFDKLGGDNLTPIERAHLLDEIDNYLLDENDNYLTE